MSQTTATREAVRETTIEGLAVKRGKVRDIYDLGNDTLLLIATDRISAYDWVLPAGIPDKGRVLTQLSAWWFKRLEIPHHMITTDPGKIAAAIAEASDRRISSKMKTFLNGRSMLVKKAEVMPIECVVRGYLAGSGWKDYQQTGQVCGVDLPEGLLKSERLPTPIFTPATKATEGHDENITFSHMCTQLGELMSDDIRGKNLAYTMSTRSLRLYQCAAEHAEQQGIILADTKFEFGLVNEDLLLIDEVFTPDSSRFWPAEHHKPGRSQPSFDKQFVRDWLTHETTWDKNSPPPKLPDNIVAQTRAKYIEAFELITGDTFAWK